MTLYKRSETVRDFNGVVVSKVSVKVVTGDHYSETAPLASLFKDAAGLIPLANPLTADAAGQYSYWAAGGMYSEKISRPGYYSVTNDGFLVGGEKGDTGPMGNPGTPGPPGLDVRPLLSDGTNPANGSGMVAHNEGLNYPAGSVGKAFQNRILASNLATGAGASFVGYLAPFTGTVARTLNLVLSDAVYLTDFSVDPSGATDSSAGLQAFFNASAIKKGVMTPGTFLGFNITVPSNATVEGPGMGRATIKLPNNSPAGSTIIKNSDQINGNSNILLRSFTLDGNKANQTAVGQFGINFSKVANSQLLELEIKSTTGNAASGIQWATPADNTANHDNAIMGCYVHDCGTTMTNNADGIAYGGIRTRISNNNLVSNSDSGVGLQGFGTSDIVITGNTIIGGTSTCIAAGDVSSPTNPNRVNSRITITGNTLRGTDVYGIYAEGIAGGSICGNYIEIAKGGGGTPDGIFTLNSSNLTVSGNVVNGCAGNGIYAGATSTASSLNVAFTGNVICKAYASGVRCAAEAAGSIVSAHSFVGNIIKNNGQSVANTHDGIGLYLPGINDSVIVVGNNLSDDQVSHTQRYGLACGGSPTNLQIASNTALGNVTAAYSPLPALTIDGMKSLSSMGTQINIGASLNVTITPTADRFHLTGSGSCSIAVIIPRFSSSSESITIFPDFAFLTTTSGNIAIASTAIVNKALTFIFDPGTAKWYPNY